MARIGYGIYSELGLDLGRRQGRFRFECKGANVEADVDVDVDVDVVRSVTV